VAIAAGNSSIRNRKSNARSLVMAADANSACSWRQQEA
jgi:hypothetical protein